MAVVTPPPDATLPQRLRFWARTRPDRVAFRQKDFGIWQPYTWADYDRLARHFGLGMRGSASMPAATSRSSARTARNGWWPNSGWG